MAQPPSMTRLIEQLTKLPGIGEKTAARLAFHVLRADRQYAQALADALVAVKDETRLCSLCFALTESDPCPICTDPRRSAETICVVEEPADLLAVERADGFRGRYHVLHGTLAPLEGIGPDELKIDRKSTRLNSSHLVISYAVFCLKKKKRNTAVPSTNYTSVHVHAVMCYV